MTYADAPPAPGATAPAPRRPFTVRFAAILLVVMALAGLAYAIVTIVITPGVVDRFRDAAAGAGGDQVDSYVTVVWLTATVGTVLAVVLFALFVVLGLGLLRGSHGYRVATWVFCGLGLLFGCGSLATVGAQRAGDGTPGSVGYALTAAYPGSWIELNVAASVVQMLGYVAVAVLLMASPRDFFGRSQEAPVRSQTYVALPTYGSQQTYAPPVGFPTHPTHPSTPSPFPPAAPPAVSPEDHAAWSRPAAPSSATSDDPASPPAESGDGHSPHSPS